MGWQDDPVIDEEIGTVAGAVSNNPAWMNDPVIEDIQEKTPSGIMALPSDINEESQKLVDVWNADQNPISKIWQTLGIAGETAGKVVGRTLETAKPVTDALLEGARFAGSDRRTIDKRLQEAPKVTSIGQEIAKTETVQDLSNTYKIFKKDNPELAANLEAGLKVLEGMTVGKVGGKGGAVAKDVAKDVAGAVPEIATKAADKLENVANRMEGSIVKINTPEAKKGASNEFYSKYNVFGDANSVQQQWSDKIKADADILRSLIKEGAQDPNSTVNIKTIIRDARKNIINSGASRAEKRETILAFNKVAEELLESYKSGSVDLLEAQKLKQYVGGKGDWLHFNGQIVKDPKMAVDAKSHDAIYDALKTTIENKGPEGIREVNKRLSEMIPMELAARKRMLVANRNNPIPLTDYIGALAVAGSAAHGNLMPAAIMGLNMASKSGTVARGVSDLSKKIRPKDPVPEGPQPITDKSRLLPYQMIQGAGDLAQPIPAETVVNGVRTVKANMEIPVGAKIRNLGESGDPKFDYKEPPQKPKSLPAPMVGPGNVEVKPAIASRGARAREIDRRVAEIGKVDNLKGNAKLTTFEELATRHKDPFNYADPDAKAKPATEPHIYSDDPRVKDLLTPAQYKKLVKDENKRIRANKDMLSDIETGNIDEALTPDQFQKKNMMEYEKHMGELNKPKSMPEVEKAGLVSSLVKKLGVGGNKVVFKDLSTDKKQVILDLVNRLNSNKEAWNNFYDKGILDKPYVQGESNIHQDDIIDMINTFNSSKSKKSLKDIRTK